MNMPPLEPEQFDFIAEGVIRFADKAIKLPFQAQGLEADLYRDSVRKIARRSSSLLGAYIKLRESHHREALILGRTCFEDFARLLILTQNPASVFGLWLADIRKEKRAAEKHSKNKELPHSFLALCDRHITTILNANPTTREIGHNKKDLFEAANIDSMHRDQYSALSLYIHPSLFRPDHPEFDRNLLGFTDWITLNTVLLSSNKIYSGNEGELTDVSEIQKEFSELNRRVNHKFVTEMKRLIASIQNQNVDVSEDELDKLVQEALNEVRETGH